MRPYSRGQIKLRSSNPLIQPSIDTNYLSDYRDVQVLIEGNKNKNHLIPFSIHDLMSYCLQIFDFSTTVSD